MQLSFVTSVWKKLGYLEEMFEINWDILEYLEEILEEIGIFWNIWKKLGYFEIFSTNI